MARSKNSSGLLATDSDRVRALAHAGFDGMSLFSHGASLSDIVSATFSMTMRSLVVALELALPENKEAVRASLRLGCHELLLALIDPDTTH